MYKIIGTEADLASKVDINKVHGGYFSSKENALAFVEIGIKPIEKELPQKIRYIDFGGGEGVLTREVANYLESKGHEVETYVIDANPKYLKKAKEKGFRTRLCAIQECELEETDLITMRAILHYNGNIKEQKEIIKKAFSCLKGGGFLVHQNSSGSKENCELRSSIVNLPSLGRVDVNEPYRWVSEKECLAFHEKSKFRENKLAGYAPNGSWGPEEQWERFNGKKSEKDKKEQFINESNDLIKKAISKYPDIDIGIEKQGNGNYVINYPYPIFVSRK